MARIIAIANQKGGVGKTTTTISLSACVAERGYRVLTIDIDPQGNTTSGLGIDKNAVEGSIYDVMINHADAQDLIVQTATENLHALPSSISLAGAEVEMVSLTAREHILKRALSTIKQSYDYIFIDCPPSLGLLTLNALTAADSLLVPIQCEYFALEGLSQLMNTVKLVRMNLNTVLEVEGVVLTMFDGRTNLSNQVVSEVRRHFNSKVYRTVIPRSIRLGEAPSYGKPISQYAPESSASHAYKSLANELIEAYKGVR